jgi:hypothetical protein
LSYVWQRTGIRGIPYSLRGLTPLVPYHHHYMLVILPPLNEGFDEVGTWEPHSFSWSFW